MKFSSIVLFEYKKQKREVLVISLDEKNGLLYGIELSTLNTRERDLVISLYNNEIFRNRMYDEELTKLARKRDDKIQEVALAHQIFIGAGLVNAIEATKIKNISATKMIMLLRRQFRMFETKKIKKLEYV